jgi:hypothetical protein
MSQFGKLEKGGFLLGFWVQIPKLNINLVFSFFFNHQLKSIEIKKNCSKFPYFLTIYFKFWIRFLLFILFTKT